ncbi:hypothetical protein [Actinoplanes sp. M2I2]|uniref:hypothetical protein n=1 Tax=Actinoplanes sp. M2I2 TaxID=1734444 RepID=UPI002020DB4C|nr:hypothetical protein [Actinoplanes sp. M2I2]
MTDQNIERGAAEEGADSPLTPTEVDASRKAPSESGSAEQPLDEHDKAESASGTDV